MSMDKIGKYYNIISGFAFKSEDLKDCADIPIIKIGNISNGRSIVFDNMQYVDRCMLKIDSKYHIKRGDVLLSLTGSHINQPNSMVGRSCRNYEDETFLLNQRAGKVIPKGDASLDYIYYVLQTKAMKDSIVCRAYGAANQVNVSPKAVMGIKWDFPLPSMQKNIGFILSAYDNMIENNTRRIRLLEQMAENLYKEWFVRFRFPGHEKYSFVNGIPSNSSIGQLKEFVIRRNKVLKKWDDLLLVDLSRMQPYQIHISDLGSAEELTSNVKQVNKFDLLFGSIRSYQGKCGYSPIDGAIAGSVYNFYPVQEYMFCFLLLLITSKPFIDYTVNYSNGTKMPVLNYKDLVRFKFPVLNDKLIYQKFNDIVLPMITEIDNLNHQNWLLKKQRDLLLPRLMSGKLEVKS